MKNIIALILIFSIAFCHISVSAEEKDLTEILDFLSVIGWGEDYTAQTIQADQEVTRAVFAENVAFLIKESETTCDKLFYHDVPREHWAFNYIARLTELGILHGSGDSNFNPEEIISGDAAVKILLSAMGCGQIAETLGGYPDGYYKAANELELLKGCIPGSRLTMYDMLKMFENALKANIFVAESYGSTSQYRISDEKTFMSELYDLHYKKGKLTACDGVDMLNGTRVKNDIAVIDGVVYDTKLKNLLANIGSSVEYVYSTADETLSEGELIWIRATGRTETLELSLNTDKMFNETEYTLSYYIDGRNIKKADISIGVVVIYNGSFVSGNVSEIFKKDKYSVKLIKSANGREYDVAVIEAYENYVVGSVDSKNLVVYDKNNGQKSLTLDENCWESISISYENMQKSFGDIKTGDVLSVLKSYDGKSVNVVISTSVSEGVVTNRGKDDSMAFSERDYICIENTKYYGFDNNALKDINLNDKIRLYLDYNGFVAYAQKIGITSQAAYLIKGHYSKLDDRCSLKLLTADGTIGIYMCAPKVEIDGVMYKTHDDIKDLLMVDRETPQQLILVEFNENNEIRGIDTLTPNTGSDFKKYSAVSGIYRSNVGKLGATVLLDDNTKIFGVPSGYSLKNDDFSVRSRANLADGTVTYTADVYRYVNEALEYEQILVMYDVAWTATGGSTAVILVEKIYQGINEDKSFVEYVEGYQAHTPVELKTNGDYLLTSDGIKSGDMIRVTMDSDGNIKKASAVYSYNSGIRPLSEDINNPFRIACVYAHDKIGNALMVGYESGEDFDEVFNMTNAKILVYDSEKKKVRIGSMCDIRTQKMGAGCSTIVAQTSYSEPVVFVVYLEN